MKPICVPCQRFFRPKKNGHYFIEAMPKGDDRPLPGDAQPDRWEPYKVWVGDLWECPDCLAQIVVGVGNTPLTEHYKEDFHDVVKRTRADQLQVNDC